jgi:hypothetical protein
VWRGCGTIDRRPAPVATSSSSTAQPSRRIELDTAHRRRAPSSRARCWDRSPARHAGRALRVGVVVLAKRTLLQQAQAFRALEEESLELLQPLVRPHRASRVLGQHVDVIVIPRPTHAGASSLSRSHVRRPLHVPTRPRRPRPFHEPTRAERSAVVLRPRGSGFLRHRITGDRGPLPSPMASAREWPP